MPTFFYSAKSISGETKTGTQEAGSEAELARSLRDQGFVLTGVQQTKQAIKIKNQLFSLLPSITGVSLTEKMMFTRHLSVMINAGLSLNKSLEVLSQQTKNQSFAKAIKNINENVRQGLSLADSLANYPKIFSDLFVNLIRVGETSGGLEDILKILAHQMEKEHELKSKIKSAMIYPVVLLVAMIIIGTLMMLLVVPTLTKIFEDMNTGLPFSTKVIIAISKFLTQHLILSLIALISVALSFRFALKTTQGKVIFDTIILRLPIFGQVSRKVNSARLARTLGSLVEGSLPIVQGLQIVSGTMTNCLFRDSLQKISVSVQKGEKLSQNLKALPNLFPPMVSQMVEIGEETGTLGTILLKLAEFYEEEVSDISKNMASIIEPVLMIFIGIAVGFFAISMLQPMYSIMGSI